MVLVEQEERVAGKSGRAVEQKSPTCAFHAGCPTSLRRILRPDIALSIWQRTLRPELLGELAELVPDEVDDILLTTTIEELETALAEAMNGAGYSEVGHLHRDVALLARHHAAILETAAVRIRLEVVETDACRKFHTDQVKVWMISTYLGQGTQWVEAPSAEEAGQPGGPPIEQLSTGSVGLFKGRLWQESPAILHRSPPIGGSGEQRLVLVIDPILAGDERAIQLQGTHA